KRSTGRIEIPIAGLREREARVEGRLDGAPHARNGRDRESPQSSASAESPRLIVEPPGYVPLTAEDRARAVAALRALFVSYFRRQYAPAQGLTNAEPGGLLVSPTGRDMPGAIECQRANAATDPPLTE